MRELTDRSQDNDPTYDGTESWRGFPYFDAIDDVLPRTFDFGEGIADSQRSWVGYVPSTDEFLCGFDLWLDIDDPDDELDDSERMCGGLLIVRLSVGEGGLAATPGRTERFEKTIYRGTKKVLQARYPDLVEVDIE